MKNTEISEMRQMIAEIIADRQKSEMIAKIKTTVTKATGNNLQQTQNKMSGTSKRNLEVYNKQKDTNKRIY